tara:strand:+ start:649 stop:1284 length:636 start_codon:yes stop_codon:yes gene_type:complete
MAKYQTNYFKTDLLTNATKAQRAKAQADAAKALSKSGRTSKPTTKKMSAAMATWVQANRGKLKNPTAKQKALFNQYDALKKAGNLPDTSKAKRRSSVAGQPSAKPKAAGTKPVNRVPQRFADGAKGGKYAKQVENKEKAKSNFFRSSSGTRGQNLPSNPKLKSQPTKPKRSSFPAGRSGATAYAAALAKYRTLLARVPKVSRKTNRRGRTI